MCHGQVGIDPEGMTAGDILRLLYARDSSTTYKRMNKEARAIDFIGSATASRLRRSSWSGRGRRSACEPWLSGCLNQSGLKVDEVLKERALGEVKAARDKPARASEAVRGR